MEIIHIQTPFFSAGKKYGWYGAPIGLGIDFRELEGEGKVIVTVGTSPTEWEIDKKKAREFIESNNSYYQANTIKLGVIAWYMFSKVEKEIKQPKLL